MSKANNRAAGFVYTGDRFTYYFSDFEKKYGFSDMYSGGFYPYSTLEEHWAYWSRFLFGNINTPVEIQQKAILVASFSSAILRHDS